MNAWVPMWAEGLSTLAGLAVVQATWQGAVLATLVALGRRAAPLLPPRVRYGALYALYVSLPVWAGATALLVWLPTEIGIELAGAPLTGAPHDTPAPWLAGVLPWLGAAWAFGAVVGVVRLLRAVRLGGRLRRDTRPADPAAFACVRRHGARLGLRTSPELRISRDAGLPAVVGLRSPAIVLPAWLRARLSDAEIDAVIAHELAHVRRCDLAARVLQRLVSALLFFHPATFWFSRMIDHERELCCDDLVTEIGVARSTYARALARLGLLHATRLPTTALGADAGDLVARVRRLANPPTPPPQPLPPARSMLLGCAALLAVVAPVAAVVLPATRHAVSSTPAWQARALAATRPTFDIQASDPAGEFLLSVKDGRAVAVVVDGRPMPPDAIHQRGATVELPAGTRGSTETFTVQLSPQGIRWDARPSRSD